MQSKTRDFVSAENGECLSKMPAATAEQLNIAKILSKPGDEVNLRNCVAQLQELTTCTEDQAVTALYDCENNLERAVELLLDKLRFGNDEEWYTTGKKQARPKQVAINDSESVEVGTPPHAQNDHIGADKNASFRTDTHPKDDTSSTETTQSDMNEISHRKRDKRYKGTKSETNHESFVRRAALPDTKFRRPVTELSESKPRSRLMGSDAWDPYTEYGEWGGEAIEVVNSNTSISRTLQEDVVLPDELLVGTEPHELNAPPEKVAENEAVFPSDISSPKSINFAESDSIFITQASSTPPPPAFTNFPDTHVFIVPELLPPSPPKWPFNFGGELCFSFRNLPPVVPTAPSSDNVNRTGHLTQTTIVKSRAESESQEYSPFAHSPSPPKSKPNNFDLSKPNAPTRSLLENPPQQSDAKTNIVSGTYTSSHFQSANAPPKVANTFSTPQKQQTTASFGTDGASGQSSNFLESSLKNYILDSLPSEMSKLSTGETPHTAKVSQYNLQTSASQTQASASSSFSHNQGGATNSVPHSVNKPQMSHMSNHSAIHASQQPVVSSASQSHQQQTASVPPGMPHFIGQFGPPAYMFNLPGSSGNAPTIFDLDQFQLLQQQQRILYDMHLQQQAATTVQSLLTPTADAPTSSKSTTHSLPGTLGHVTAANAAGIRPDMLASAMGHAPQMVPTGHPYFSYPGFVLMNGYSNAFLNQQQQQQQQQQSGQDSGQNQSGTGHSNASITQHQTQPNSSAQSYSGLKSVNTNVASYDDLFDMKYGDPAKQVGFKNTGNPNYGSFQGALSSNEVMASKMSSNAGHSTSGVLTQGFNANSGTGQPFSPPFYPSAPYQFAAAVAVAAAAAASAQQQQAAHGSGTGSANQSNASGNNPGMQGGSAGSGGGGPNSLHQSNGGAQAMVLGSSGSTLHAPHPHHQRSVMPQQY